MLKPKVTAHCLVKNEEVFVGYAIRSVIDFVDRILVFDTGSTDSTVTIVKDLQTKYPEKIFFEEKGPADKKRHTELRQEMVDRTETEWIMLLDGDEVWKRSGMEEAFAYLGSHPEIDSLASDIYLCAGDVQHTHNRFLMKKINKISDLKLARFYRKVPGLHWSGDYGLDGLYREGGELIWENCPAIKQKFWHTTHLKRSRTDDNDYTSNTAHETRKSKRRETFFLIGEKINESLPEVFDEKFLKEQRLSWGRSFVNFWPYFFKTLKKRLYK